ncbi:MAG: hypothetical protein QM770_06235 [Tepidisphaeraceae bacterium]
MTIAILLLWRGDQFRDAEGQQSMLIIVMCVLSAVVALLTAVGMSGTNEKVVHEETNVSDRSLRLN